jgi:phosphate transport system permease protein
MKINSVSFKENFFRVVFLMAALFAIFAVVMIILFIAIRSFPVFARIGFFKLVFGSEWNPSAGQYGILPAIVGSIYVTAGSILLGAGLGVLTSICISCFVKKGVRAISKQLLSLLAGIPSVVFGLFGIIFVLPLAMKLSPTGYPFGTFAASIVVGIMILPTIVTISSASIEAVPAAYYEGAVALGATCEQANFKVVVPAAKSGIVASVILGTGRALGEAMAVRMVLSNSTVFPKNFLGLFDSFNTLTSHITNGYQESGAFEREVLIATGFVLFIFILALNVLLRLLTRERKK